MQPTSIPSPRARSKLWAIPLAAVCGTSLALFCSGYFLTDFLPAGSRLLILLTCGLAALGTAGFYFLLRWTQVPFSKLTPLQRVAFVGVSLILAASLFFGGTSRWRSSSRYVPFFLPSHHLAIAFVPGRTPLASQPNVRLSWFNTSLGDVSYDTIRMHGWKRVGDELVLQDPATNRLEWDGRTGGTAQLVFRVLQPQGKLAFAWDSREEQLALAAGKLDYVHSLDVPWYASTALVCALGIFTFSVLVLPLILLLWEKRETLATGIRDSLTPAATRFDGADAAFLCVAVAVALLLRLPNLGMLFPAVDEYYHLIAARQIAEGAAFGSVYQRGLWLVTVPVSIFLRAFGYQLWAARMVGALFNTLAIFPLYLLTRKINRPVAVLSIFLYATSPWMVTFARIAREYAFYPFYFYWIVLGMVYLIELIPQGSVLRRDWRVILTPKLLLTGLLLCIPPLFALYGDRLSTFRTILLAYPVLMIFVLGRFDLKNRSNIPFVALLTGGFLFAIYGWVQRQSTKIVPFPRYNSIPVEYFLPNPQQQWYFDRLVLLPVIGLLAVVVCSILVSRRNFVPAFLLALYAAFMAFFAFFSESFFHTRHLSTTELWYVVVVAMGLYLVWRILASLMPWKGQMANVAILAALCLSVINVAQVAAPTISTNPDNPISEDYLHDLTQVQAYMMDHAEPGDVLISTVYGLYSSWKGEPQFEAQYRITTQTPREEILALVDQHESGWIVIDQIRLAMSNLGAHEFSGVPDVEFVGSFGDEYVWHWQHAPAGAGSLIDLGKE